MTNFQSLSGLGQIAGDYDVLLCDIWGVVHNGQAENKAATEALELFRGENGPVILISNSPKPSVSIPHSFETPRLTSSRAAHRAPFLSSGQSGMIYSMRI